MGITRLLSIPAIVLILHQVITGFIAKVVCYGYLLETNRRDDTNVYSYNMILLKIEKK